MKIEPDPEARAAKAALRARFRAAREALTAEEYAALSTAICERIGALPEVERARTVHVYWPLVTRREVDTRPLIRHLGAAGKRVALPVVVGFEGAPVLRHVAFEGEARMRANRWGIAEPHGTAEVAPEEIDAVVVPALGAGRDGHRLGHGRGFYDAFLVRCPAVRIGAVYARCLVEAVPAEPHDARLDVIVTEAEAVRVR